MAGSSPRYFRNDEYGKYKWHTAWTVDKTARTLTHKTKGLVVQCIADCLQPAGCHFTPKRQAATWALRIKDVGAVLTKAQARLLEEAHLLAEYHLGALCVDCNVCTLEAENEYYMLQHDVWQSIMGNYEGMLCMGCASKRLGRPIAAPDLLDCAANHIFNKVTAKMLADHSAQQKEPSCPQ